MIKWFQPRVKKIPKSHRETLKKLTPKEEAHKQNPEDRLLGTHIEALTWIQSYMGIETFKIIERYSPELIEELIDGFHFEKYKENQLEIDAIMKKRIIFDK